MRTIPGARTMGRITMLSGLDRRGRDAGWLAVLFHHVTDGDRWCADDPFIAGLGVDVPVDRFVDHIDHLRRRYDVVGLDQVLTPATPTVRRRRVLICFDDAYRSVASVVAPLLHERHLPWCLFLNPGLVGNETLSLDNFVAYVFAVHGARPLETASGHAVRSPGDLLLGPLADLPPAARRRFVADVAASVGEDPGTLAHEAGLYLDADEVRALAEAGVEIGNHTTDHVSCRALGPGDAEEQIVGSAAAIEAMTGHPVRAFAYPYGSRDHVTPVAADAVRRAGHRCAFLVHGLGNDDRSDPHLLHRVHLAGSDDATIAFELAVLPRLRALRAHRRHSRPVDVGVRR